MNRSLTPLLTGLLISAVMGSARGAEPAADVIVRFDISHFDVKGNDLLAPSTVDALLLPFAGKQRDFGDVQRALEALEAAYHTRGYKLVTVELPEQELKDGAIILKVVKTKIGRVNVTGNTVFDEANIRRSLPDLREGDTPNLTRLSTGLKQANENPAKKVTMKLQSGELDDEVDAALAVTDERAWKATLNLDNTGTSQTGTTHAGVVLQHANLWGRDHVASVQYTTTVEKPSAVSVYGAGYHIPLYALGDSLDFFGSYSNVDSGTVAAGLISVAVSGKGASYGARYNMVLGRPEDGERRLVVGLDYKAFKNIVLYADQNLGNNVTVHPLSLTFQGAWPSQNGNANLALTLVRNIPGGQHGASADFATVRIGAPAGYTLVRVAAAGTRALSPQWQARLIVNGQWARDALIPGEQFGAGGSTSVRGFTERAVAGDSGLATNAELYSRSYCPADSRWQCQVVGFVDAAYVRRNHALPGELVSTAISAVGLGLRLTMGANLNLQIDYGHALRTGAATDMSKNRLHIRLGMSY